MNLQQLLYFKTIAEYEHYTKAAEMLSASQSSLSHAMQTLEQELGANLFVRNGRNIALSTYGKLFLPHVIRALEALDEGVEEIREAVSPETGMVSIACFPSIAEFVPDIVVRYISETNRMEVQPQTEQAATYYALREMLLSGKVHLVFATQMEDTRIESVYIGEQDFVLLVPEHHPLAERENIRFEELDGEDFIAYSRDSQLRRQLDRMCRQKNIKPRITAETSQDIMIYGLVAAGRGIAITPYPLGRTPYNVKLVRIEGAENRKLYLLWNKDAYLPPAATQFRDYVMQQGAVFDEYRLRNHIA